MKLEVGDKVKFLNEVGGGTIIGFLDNKTANVLTDDDWEIPTPIVELLKIAENDKVTSGYDYDSPVNEAAKVTDEQKSATGRKSVVQPKTELLESVFSSQEGLDDEKNRILLAFVPINQFDVVNSDLKLFIINNSAFQLLFNVMIPHEETYKSRAGMLEPHRHSELSMVNRQALNELKNIIVQAIYSAPFTNEAIPPVYSDVKIRPVRFYKEQNYHQTKFFRERALTMQVIKNELEEHIEELLPEVLLKIKEQKEVENVELNKPKQFEQKVNPAFLDEEVDLHIHNLVDNEAGLSPKEKLDIQMKHFTEALEDATRRRINSIIFIHGIGGGTLKYEIRRVLERSYKQFEYQDASFEKYGFGATRVFTRKKKK